MGSARLEREPGRRQGQKQMALADRGFGTSGMSPGLMKAGWGTEISSSPRCLNTAG